MYLRVLSRVARRRSCPGKVLDGCEELRLEERAHRLSMRTKRRTRLEFGGREGLGGMAYAMSFGLWGIWTK